MSDKPQSIDNNMVAALTSDLLVGLEEGGVTEIGGGEGVDSSNSCIGSRLKVVRGLGEGKCGMPGVGADIVS